MVKLVRCKLFQYKIEFLLFCIHLHILFANVAYLITNFMYGGNEMQDMLSKIVDMDEKVRIQNKQAEQRKADSLKMINKKKDDIYNDYISRARERIKKNAKAEKEAADKKWQKLEAKQKESLAMLDESFKKNGDTWINAIVDNVINS